MYRMAIMLLCLPEQALAGADRHRCITMALVHDMAEAIVGDLTPECGVSSEAKRQMEEDAMQVIVRLLPSDTSILVKGLFDEYESGESREAKLVKEIDKLEFLVQTGEYEQSKQVYLEEFFHSTRHRITNPFLIDLMARVDDERT